MSQELDLTEISPKSPLSQRHILTVQELTQDIKKLLETGFDSIWVKGEISSLKKPSSGHYYFVLKDEKAVLNSVMFKFRNQKIKFNLEEGLEVICGGRLSLYEPRGSYQILVDIMEPVGLGALQLRFEQLKEKLEKEGLFRKDLKKPLPYLPQKIALITSRTGAAIHDMLNVINRRFSNIEILLFPVAVQGENAAPEIVKALQLANELNRHDVIILGRGGGSLEDLWAFNEEMVARAIFESHIPVISAVGHEIDFTIADFVADLRAPTPSAAAELVVKNKADLQNNLLNQLQRLRQAYLTILRTKQSSLSNLSGRIINPRRRLEDWRLRLSDLEERLQYTLIQNVKAAKNRYSQTLPDLTMAMRRTLERHQKHLERLHAVLKTLNPLDILERGYSIAQDKMAHIVRRSSEVKLGETLSIRLFEGEVICQVKEVKP